MEKFRMDQIGSANFIHVTLKDSIAISAIVRFIHVEILQLVEAG